MATRTTVEPLGDRVMVQVLPEPEQSAGGVHIPDSARERPQRGLVVEVGPGRSEVSGGQFILVPLMIDQGDTVLFSKYAGTEVPGPGVGGPMDRVQHLLLREADVLGIEKEVEVEEPDEPAPRTTDRKADMEGEGYSEVERDEGEEAGDQ
jgi:chaperonin GroES